MDPRVPSLAEAASAAFGQSFRYTDEFSPLWLENQLNITRGRRVSKTVSTLYWAVWDSLDTKYPERVVDWPSWPEQRPLQHNNLTFLHLTRCKPLERETIVAIYSEKSVQIAARGNEEALFRSIFECPPLPLDVTWNNKEKKKGLKTPDEEWPENAAHIAKSSLQLSDIFQPALGVASSSRPSRPSPPVFRFDYAEQVVKHQSRDRSLHSHLSGLTWNAGSRRQGIDISCFVAGTWSYIALQEADPWTWIAWKLRLQCHCSH